MILFCGIAVVSAFMTGLYRWIALRRRWLDTPNHRSSHTTVTPRGAGVIFAALIVVVSIAELASEWRIAASIALSAVVAAVGWWDDLRGASIRVRFALYLIVAACVVALIRGYDDAVAAIPLFAVAIGVMVLVWLINLYNFMDGINGIASLEAIFILLAVGALAHGSAYAQVFQSVHWASTGAIAGFLLWNFPAGKVFMGDAGSAFLGFLLGVLMLWSMALHGPAPIVWLILLGVFIVDTSYTLIVRAGTRQVWYEAHRLHAYQKLFARWNSHSAVVSALMAVNLGWLLPLAWLVQNQLLNSLVGLGVAYLPLVLICYCVKAGVPADSRV